MTALFFTTNVDCNSGCILFSYKSQKQVILSSITAKISNIHGNKLQLLSRFYVSGPVIGTLYIYLPLIFNMSLWLVLVSTFYNKNTEDESDN